MFTKHLLEGQQNNSNQGLTSIVWQEKALYKSILRLILLWTQEVIRSDFVKQTEKVREDHKTYVDVDAHKM